MQGDSQINEPMQLATSPLPCRTSKAAPLDPLFSPRKPISRGLSASQILAAFSPKPQPEKKQLPLSDSSLHSHHIVMEQKQLRHKEHVSYEISSDSDNANSPHANDSSFSTPKKPARKRISIIDLDDELKEIEPPKTPPPRISAAGHSLRQHENLHLSLRAQENGDKRVLKKRRLSVKAPRRSSASSQISVHTPKKTARNEIRDHIATVTAGKRADFFVANKDLFLPLLPEGNHIQRLADQRQQDVSMKQHMSVPYEVLRQQPAGVTAAMKPYQLLGLSFLVWLHRNGLSGILGDEMGLGKTLQTLSLFQYLKEHRKQSNSSELRPCLVVCPLSVLSSWMAESKKWTPGLKVLRFHGPIHERNRLKQIAMGEIDIYGNKTKGSRKKKNDRKSVIHLDDSDDEIDEPGVDLIVTTYEGFQAEQSWFKKAFVWSYVVLDEGHKIKNDLSLISKALQGLGAEYRLILTGTPLQNNLVELWALLHWLYPEVFTERTADLFRLSFNLTKGQVSTKVMDDSRRLLEIIMLRRMKRSEGVDLNLPPKTEVLLYVPLTHMQRFWYIRLLTRADQGLLEELFQGAGQKETVLLKQEAETDAILKSKDLEALEALEKQAAAGSNESAATADWAETKEIMRQALAQEQADESKKSAWRKLMNLLMQLRKCCNHPYILPHAEPDPYYNGEHVIHASAKFIILDKIIEELVSKQKKKVLIFSGFSRMLDCCEDFLALRGGNGEQFKYVRLDGRTPRARRNLGIRMFNQQESNYRVMLISTRAGGLGINLATASDVIMLDQDWNPQIMLQAEARAHRIGQTNPVTVYKLCTQGTVEEQMMGRIQKKLYLSAKVTESMRDIHLNSATKKKGPGGRVVETEDEMPQLDTSQLLSLVRRGAQTLAHPELDINEMIGWDWPTMLDKCKDKPADILVAEQTQTNVSVKEDDEKSWLSQIEHVESRVFQGKKHSKAGETNGGIAQEWSRESRRVGKNTTVMVDGYAVSKESMTCGDWEAVPTMAGKDPRLAEPKRDKKPAVVNQGHCQVCWDGGDLTLCSLCPRSYHYGCLDRDAKSRSKSKMNFSCPQHQCVDCSQKTTDAGGMLYRCRWCERGFCEDCLDWDKTDLLGENLKEYELLGFPAVTQAFYIKCPNCTDDHVENPKALAYCKAEAAKIDGEYQKIAEEQALLVAGEETKKTTVPPSRAESMTDATTVDSSGITTPRFNGLEQKTISTGGKRKAAPDSFEATPTKRSKRLTT